MTAPDSVNNPLGMPIGKPVNDWITPERPDNKTLTGNYCRLEPLDPARHGEQLFNANQQDREDRIWVYLPYGPFSDQAAYLTWLESVAATDDPFFYAVIDSQSNQAIGVASYLRIDPTAGSIEVGHINFSPALQKTKAATETMYLMMKNAFDLGYRRYEWKCDALNAGSKRAATRLGFSYEGLFRQAAMYKNRNRDTRWYSIINQEWPALDSAFQQWLSPDNFDQLGQQKTSLSVLTQVALKS